MMTTLRTRRLVSWVDALYAVVAAVTLLTGCQSDISGAYLASDQNAVCWLQLVRTPDNHLTGQLAASIMKSDGSVEQASISVTGAVDGENVSLTGSRFLGLESVMLGGTLRGNVLNLNGTQGISSQAIPSTFVRSSVTAYQQQVSALNARAQAVIRANAAAKAKADADRQAAQLKAEEVRVAAQSEEDAQRAAFQAKMQAVDAVGNLVNAIDQTTAKMKQFDAEADVHLGRFPNAEKTYQGITAKMTQYVDREQQLAGNPNASVARSQLVVAANQASLMTDQVHDQIVPLGWSLQNNVKPIADELTFLEQRCSQPAPAPSDDALARTRSAACSRLSDAATPFRQKFNAISSGLTNLERAYQAERDRQQRLIQTAENLQ